MSAPATPRTGQGPFEPSRPARWPDEIEPSEVQNPVIRKGWEMWNRLKGERLYPARDELSPRVLRGLSRHIALVKVIDGGREFEFRVIGDAIVMAQGASHQGWSMAKLEEAMPGSGKRLLDVYGRVAATGRPAAFRGALIREHDGLMLVRESLILPLGAAGVDHILAILVYSDRPDALLH